jgi:hypothetical protein
MMCAMADGWKRLVFDFQQPQCVIFNVLKTPDYDEDVVKSVVGPLLLRLATCAECVDPHFTAIWARRLADDRVGVRRRAHRCLGDVIAVSNLVSGRVERKHLVGQERKKIEAEHRQRCRYRK